jgi:hypothetical protein
MNLGSSKEEQEALMGIMMIDATGETDINASLLHNATATCDRDTILKILQQGADIMAEDSQHRLPLEAAITNKNSKSLHQHCCTYTCKGVRVIT